MALPDIKAGKPAEILAALFGVVSSNEPSIIWQRLR